jgi:putative tryptophan/tyrosine transport system substrate-binding protein
MRRREFIGGLGSAAAWPAMARAQQTTVPIVGFLHNATFEAVHDRVRLFSESLAQGGYLPGRNVAIEYRFADNRNDQLPALAAELVRLRVAVIATTNTPPALAAHAATPTIPILFNIGGDPVQLGLVASLSRPGGNVTGVSTLNISIVSKRLELLNQIVPAATSIALLVDPTNPESTMAETVEAERAAKSLGRQLIVVAASTTGDLEAAFASLRDQGAGALMVNAYALFFTARDQIAALASRYAIPVISAQRELALAGSLMSYGTDNTKVYSVLGTYCARILNGEKVSDLPVQQITRVELFINLRTAKALGLNIPETLLATADEVIQ